MEINPRPDKREANVKQITEPERKTPVIAETEVLVVGSGPGGLSAAIASAREGVDTILVERYGYFGGNITGAMVESIGWYRHEGTVEAGGIGLEFEEFTKELGGTNDDPESIAQLLDADMFKIAADEMVENEGVTPLLHALVVDGIVENGKIKGVITESKSGRGAILAERVIDATGDADVAARVGAPFNKADKEDLMSATVGFGMSGVDVQKFKDYVNDTGPTVGDWARETSGKEDELFSPYFKNAFERARSEGVIPQDVPLDGYWDSITKFGEATGLNLTRVKGIDPTDVWDLTKAEIEGRKQVMWAVKALREFVPGFDGAELRTIGSAVGTRESRKIIGQYNLTEDDVMNQAEFDDSIGIFPEFLDAYGMVILPTDGRYFQVPYRITIPQGVDNLLVAGRSVAGDQVSHSATRQMMCCTVTGQGAGVAAARSVKDKTTTSEVNIDKVQEDLRDQGVRID